MYGNYIIHYIWRVSPGGIHCHQLEQAKTNNNNNDKIIITMQIRAIIIMIMKIIKIII